MCTLSWLPGPSGYRVYFNRDERLTRAPARPPSRRVVRGTTVLAPIDGDFGGTWIGVNQHGLTASLLNRYEDAPAEPDPAHARISRGLLLLDLLAAPNALELLEALGRARLPDYLPFTIAATDRDPVLHLADWNGRTLERSATRRGGLIRTSSGRDQRQAELIRGRVWHEILGGTGDVSVEKLEDFHRSHLPERGPFSVCMHREEAATRSLTVVAVEAGQSTVRYQPGSPCLGIEPVVARLPDSASH